MTTRHARHPPRDAARRPAPGEAGGARSSGHATVASRRPLPVFLVLTAALSWWPVIVKALAPAFPAIYVFPLGPSLAAVILAAISGGRPRLKALVRRLGLWRVGLRWYAAALAIPIMGIVAAVALNALLGAPAPTSSQLVRVLQGLPVLYLFMVLAALGEELGWRGYALPRLQAGRPALAAALLLALCTTVWHLPNYLPGGAFADWPFPSFVLFSVAVCVLYVWLYTGSGGSLLVVVLGHAMGNAVCWPVRGLVADADRFRLDWLVSVLLFVLVGAIALGSGMARRAPVPREVVAEPAPAA